MKMSMELLRMSGLDNSKTLREVRIDSMDKALRSLRAQQRARKSAERSAVTLAVRS